MSVKQILAQTGVTSKRKLIIQYIHVWNGHLITPKGNRGFF